MAAVNNFRNRCKSFFMELVALYCFGEQSQQMPNPGLVEKFIGYFIKKTKEPEISLHLMVKALIVLQLFDRLSCSSYWLKNQGNSSAFFLVNNQV